MAVAGFPDLDFHEFHRDQLPERMAAGNAALAARSVARLGRLALRLTDGAAYTYGPSAGAGVAVVAGDEHADHVFELDHETWVGLAHDYESAPGILYAARARCLRGRGIALVEWEPALRALYHGRPIYDPERVCLEDRHGAPLDVEQVFSLDADPEEMAHFLRTAGYLFVREVFSPEETAGFLEEAEQLRGEARKGDKLSWWGRNAAGEEVLCRVTRAADKPRLATLPGDPRLRRLRDLTDVQLVPRDGEGNGVTVIYKIPEMVEGLANLPWHRDCGMGGHAVMCPVLQASVFLTPGTPETGDLRMLPGSWQTTMPYLDASHARAPQGARFAARPGDVSLHYGDVMHAAPPPSRSDLGTYRISAVTGFARPGARPHGGARSYNEVLHGRDDGQIEHLEQVAKRL